MTEAQANEQILKKYTTRLSPASRAVIGRKKEIQSLRAIFCRPEICNAILLGDAGSGKTTLVQGLMEKDPGRIYLEVNMEQMINDIGSDVAEKLAAQIKTLFSAVESYQKEAKKELVLFIDEFHRIVQLSPAAVEALKPLLALSGTRGIRLLAATTYEEFRTYIAPNQPLVERLEQIRISPPDRESTIQILKNMAQHYQVSSKIASDNMYGLIVDYTNRFIPSDSQPRKSLKVLESMIGWNRSENVRMDRQLLAHVIEDSIGININFQVDADSIKKRLDAAVLSQTLATTRLEEQLQVAAANLQDKTRPMASFLFVGPTGVGKTQTVKEMANILFGDSKSLIRFDMTEYALEDSIDRFRKDLTARIWERPHSILLLDEIEKASKSVTHLLLQVLDDGRLIDENNREVPFVNSYIIMTSNAGDTTIYENIASYSVDDTGSGKHLAENEGTFMKSLIDDKLPPELLGRIDVIVPFQPLSEKTRKAICVQKVQKIIDEIFKEHGVHVGVHPDVIDYLMYDNTSNDPSQGGARNMIRVINTQMLPLVSRYILTHPGTKRISIEKSGIGSYEDKTRLRSDAKLVVKAIQQNFRY